MEKNNELCEIEGCVEHIVYRNEQNGFTVFEIDSDGELVCVVGEVGDVSEGENVRLSGYYTSHPTYGEQFKAELCVKKLPESASAIRRYLEGGAIKGIGRALAKSITDRFGRDSLDIIENSPEELTQIKGITLKKAITLSQEFKSQNSIRTVMAELSKYSIPSAFCIKLWKKYGDACTDILEMNPFVLSSADIGAEFSFADEIARGMGVLPNDGKRIAAGLLFILNHNLLNGHTCLPTDKLASIGAEFLGVSEDECLAQMQFMHDGGTLVLEFFSKRYYAYLPELHEAESYVGLRLKLLSNVSDFRKPPDDIEISAIERESGVVYAEKQREAIREAMINSLFILTGGPGSGKTTTLNAIILLCRMRGETVTLAAPTGRAAKRMAEVTGTDAKTIHRLLEAEYTDGETLKFRRNEKNPIKSDVIIIDEMSMTDIMLFSSLLKAVRMGSRLILVGDKDQLPSVGAGNVLGDMLKCDMISYVELDHVFRQAAQSMIVTNAHDIINGKYPTFASSDGDFFLLRRENYQSAADTVTDLCVSRLPKSYGFSGMWDIQVLCPGKKGELGSQTLNLRLQNALNPASPDKKEFKSPFSPYLFREGDKIMQIRNNYDIPWERYSPGESDADILSGHAKAVESGTGIFNGDIGRIIKIFPAEKRLLAVFDDRLAEYGFDMAGELEPAYAVTVHKSQGSEYDAVILSLMRPSERLYFRNLLYTAVTRAKKLLIIVGNRESVDYMVDNNRKTVRYSNLDRFMLRETPGYPYR